VVRVRKGLDRLLLPGLRRGGHTTVSAGDEVLVRRVDRMVDAGLPDA
jgi:hypothetical protein